MVSTPGHGVPDNATEQREKGKDGKREDGGV